MKAHRFALLSAFFVSSVAALAADANYKVAERIKVPDGGFDYATFDPATGRVLMTRTDFTTVIDRAGHATAIERWGRTYGCTGTGHDTAGDPAAAE